MKQVLRFDYYRGLWRGAILKNGRRRFNLWLRSCWNCGTEELMVSNRLRPACRECDPESYDPDALKQRRAHNKVSYAIRKGQLAKLDGSVKCVDCDEPAKFYDHRDYSKPLDVQPVCQRCNRRRGPAVDSGARK